MKSKIAILILALASLPAAAQRPDHAKFEAAVQAACGTDIANYCADIADKHEQGRCLHDNANKLSNSCAEFMAKMKHHGPPHPRDTASASAAGQ